MVRIAIVIPTFNSAKTLAETLDSVQNQKMLERVSAVYIADDCSEDNSLVLAQSTWRASVPLHTLRRTLNMGERDNVNNALSIIGRSSDWILLLHSDDTAKPVWLEMMIHRIDNCSDNVGSICSSWDMLMPDLSIIPGENDLHRQVEVICGDVEEVRGTVKRGCWWHISGCAIRLATIEDVGGFKTHMAQVGDWEWLLRCLNKGWDVEYIPRTLILYRQHETSVSQKSFLSDRDIIESLEVIRQYKPHLRIKEIVDIHARYCKYASRRFARALVELRFKRCLIVVTSTFLIVLNFVKCLFGRNFQDKLSG